MSGIAALGTILGVWAHPDDETYSMAGIMAAAVQNGQRVALVTATRGELGSFDADRWPTSRLGQIRQAELERSLAVLGVTRHQWLGYPDGGCRNVDQAEAERRLVAEIGQINPDAIFTFGPDGMTGHNDHITVSNWATAAFKQAAKPGSKLFYSVFSQELYDEFGAKLDELNVFFNIERPPVLPLDQMDLAYQLPPAILSLKTKAVAAHVSQVEGMLAAFGPKLLRQLLAVETFRLAAVKTSQVPPDAKM